MTSKSKARRTKRISIFLLLTFSFELFFPTTALALTGGPSQPEFTGFQPIGVTDMVNVFNGNFSYNLPLMEVPGPNGGYPLNLSYDAGIGMEQEASWVGLGWNLNVGSITRNLRGVPDDFNGDKITKSYYIKPNWNLGLTVGSPGFELFNFDASKGSLSGTLYYNSYKGAGIKLGLDAGASLGGVLRGKLAINFDNRSGLDVNPSLSLQYKFDNIKRSFGVGIGASFHSTQGFRDLSYSYVEKDHRLDKKDTDEGYGPRPGMSFASKASVPVTDVPMRGMNVGVALRPGFAGLGVAGKVKLGANFADTWVAKEGKSKDYKSYGYLYAQNRDVDEDLADFNREKDNAITKDAPYLAIPNFSYDIFNVRAQGQSAMFRPRRSDFGVLSDPYIKSTNGGGEVTLEAGAGSDGKIGGDFNVVFGKSTSGSMELDDDFRSNFDFKGSIDPADNIDQYQKYEPYYFKNASEKTAEELEVWNKIRGEQQVAIRMKMGFSGGSFKPRLSNYFEHETDGEVSESSKDPIKAYRETRERKETNMIVRTIGDLGGTAAQTPGTHIVSANNFPRTTTPTTYNYENGINSQIGKMQCINPNGYTYHYEIPVYNTYQKEAVFAIDSRGGGTSIPYSKTTYSSSDAAANNNNGQDEFFKSTEIPKYAHSYLLTQVTSPDYVDLTGDGPTDDDFGYWAKFYYNQHATSGSPYQWRHPYEDANYSPGHYSNTKDDKASYTYGKKEIYYLNAVETKTHIAEFTLSDREDGRGARAEHTSTQTPKTLKRLDKITLYSKLDPNYASGTPTPIKEVHFVYDYTLCNNAKNNLAGNGKLTLKQVYFTYGVSDKSSLSPYTFEYTQTGRATDQNPDYKLSAVDRWGLYKDFGTSANQYANHVDNPYTNQNEDYDNDGDVDTDDYNQRSDHASAWNLRKITLPSGGIISVDYESDDYAYVQDKKAMNMMKVVGASTATGNTLSDSNTKVYFDINEDPSASGFSASDVNKYYQSLVGKDIFFKMYLDLKNAPFTTSMKRDYVKGYAKISGGGYDATAQKGWVNFQTVKKHNNSTSTVHPVTKAGWQYLRMSRPDLFNDPGAVSGSPLNILGVVWSFLKSVMQLITGFYNYCDINGYARDINLSDQYESFIRLEDNNGIKYGGGHRVKRIAVNDSWDTMTASAENSFDYGQEYSYRLPDGTSSGVASYEPMIGGEENPHRVPFKYSSDDFVYQKEELYIEAPIGESFYPGADVGYSRVMVKNITRTEELDGSGNHKNRGSASPVMIHEFYTSKDFPVIERHTQIQNDDIYNLMIPVPFIGVSMFNNRGYSQGYSIHLNDMNGQRKSLSTFKYGTDYNDKEQAVYREEYEYNTLRPYSSNSRNELNSTLPVLFGEKILGEADLGKSMDFYMDTRHNYTYTQSIGAQIDVHLLNLGIIMIPWFTGIPVLNFNEQTFSSVVTNKVVFKSAVLKKVKTFKEGVLTEHENLYFDSETGRPLVTRTTNEYNDDIYKMDIPGHWYDKNFMGTYKNIGIAFGSGDYSVNGSNEVSFTDVADHRDYFAPGDQLKIGSSKQYWVEDVSSTYIKIKNHLNSYVSPSSGIEIYNSGFKNSLSASLGSLVSKTDPVINRKMAILSKYNYNTDKGLHPTGSPIKGTASDLDCNGDNWYIEISSTPITSGLACINTAAGSNVLYAKANRTRDGVVDHCDFQIRILNTNYLSDNPIGDVRYLTFERSGDRLVIKNNNSKTYYALIDYCDASTTTLGSGCIDDVITATAASGAETGFTYNYSDLVDVDGNPISTTYADPSSTSINGYKIGRKGIWRPSKAYVYQNDRNGGGQASNIQIRQDGDIDNFNFFDHAYGNNIGPNWILAEQTTMLDPYGNHLEAQDAVGVYSSALYGYGNSLVIAYAANAEYSEIGYESFEEHPASGYVSGGLSHIGLSSGSLVSTESHTGEHSLSFTGTTDFIPANISSLALTSGKSYSVSVWMKNGGSASAIITGGSTTNSVIVAENIDGWDLHNLTFTAPSTLSDLTIRFTAASGGSYMDDLRLSPSESSISTYVYDKQSLNLTAILDQHNFAEIYAYDEEHKLVRINQETDQGIITIRESRSHIQQ